MDDASPESFLLFLVRSVASEPDAVQVSNRTNEKDRSVFEVSVGSADEERLCQGALYDALQTAFDAFTYKHRIRARLELRA
ncbi:MAG: hypothetical protein CMP23_03970 [Rickettsiales bacterium]|nr:hypothetical protein [Rickettsiales bacterium]|tara:strand:- start:5799 stop:6041 length:243 start_codon:yes stop_codon:yes gene_type:complete